VAGLGSRFLSDVIKTGFEFIKAQCLLAQGSENQYGPLVCGLVEQKRLEQKIPLAELGGAMSVGI